MKKTLLAFVSLACLLSCETQQKIEYSHSNPILQATAFIPDGEPRIFNYEGEERLFLYGSRDERITGYCGYGHDVWSAPIYDLSRWRNHGEVFNVEQVKAVGYGDVAQQHFGAPDCVYNPVRKKYYLYTFLGAVYTDAQIDRSKVIGEVVAGYSDQHGPKCVMAQSDSPAGPFLDPVICDWAPANNSGTFDPAVLVDPQADGSVRVYAYWGMRIGDRCAELDPTDMHTVINPESKKPDKEAWHKVLPEEKSESMPTLFEASSIRKIDDNHYVFICSPNHQHSMLYYFYGNSPLGPWQDGGCIVNNMDNWRGGNNHGGIVKIGDQWYVCYHRHSAGGINRQAMMQPIELTVDGDKVLIPQIELTTQATSYNGLDPFKRYNVSAFCYKKSNSTIVGYPREADGLQPLVDIKNGELLGLKYFNFGTKGVKNSDKMELRLNIRVLQEFNLKLLCAEVGKQSEMVEFANLKLKPQGDGVSEYTEVSLPIDNLNSNAALLSGLKAIYFGFESDHKEELCQIKEFEFAHRGTPTPNPLMDISVIGEDSLIELIPSRARCGESVKITVNGSVGSIRVETNSGKAVELHKNADVPYAPVSYNFEMPDAPVQIVYN